MMMQTQFTEWRSRITCPEMGGKIKPKKKKKKRGERKKSPATNKQTTMIRVRETNKSRTTNHLRQRI
jgi:hypothetical protein